ncbi:MAG: hypothetical protein AcusKO_42420 [Acuticoccus sp.]
MDFLIGTAGFCGSGSGSGSPLTVAWIAAVNSLCDQGWEFMCGNRVVGDVGGDDLGGEINELRAFFVF